MLNLLIHLFLYFILYRITLQLPIPYLYSTFSLIIVRKSCIITEKVPSYRHKGRILADALP